jgi:hypothetical protein
MSLNSEIEKDLTLLLKLVYDRANWKRIGRNSYQLDVFSHKIKAASHQSSMTTFMERLCYSLGVQSICIDPALVMKLNKESNVVLRALRKETIYYMLLAVEVKN